MAVWGIGIVWNADRAVVAFRFEFRMIRFVRLG